MIATIFVPTDGSPLSGRVVNAPGHGSRDAQARDGFLPGQVLHRKRDAQHAVRDGRSREGVSLVKVVALKGGE